jgi:hypothetical protein
MNTISSFVFAISIIAILLTHPIYSRRQSNKFDNEEIRIEKINADGLTTNQKDIDNIRILNDIGGKPNNSSQ